MGELTYLEYFEIFTELGFPFFNVDKKFKTLYSLKDDDLKLEFFDELLMLAHLQRKKSITYDFLDEFLEAQKLRKVLKFKKVPELDEYKL